MRGLVLMGVGSFYTMLCDGERYVCKARGRFRKEKISPYPGDIVEFTPGDGDEGCITEILPRRNMLTRPSVANVDKLVIVLTASSPKPDLLLLDKLLLSCEAMGVTPVICVNKCDEYDEEVFLDIAAQYAPTGYKFIRASAHTGEGIDALKTEISGCTSCFAGQSAVGKSSILNALLPGAELETGGLSRKTDRGRHTTRHAELMPAFGGAVADTPGFSLLEPDDREPWELYKLYPEMRKASGECRFSECLHLSEPDCAVKPQLATGALSMGRYERYKIIVEELLEKRKHKYD